MNEAKTEILVRKILESLEYENDRDIIQEEKKSDNPRINKLLKTASKRGSGAGYPEFIIYSKKHTNLLIVIECKAKLNKHRSKTLDNYSDFAVDGVLLYSSYLSKEFDVVSIGVSGESKNELQIDTYLQIKGEEKARDLNIKQIYAFNGYYELLKNDDLKEKKDYEKLIEYSKVLNQTLRDDFEFEETYRPLIVSGILLALEDDSFCSAYIKKQKPIEIANLLVTTIKERLNRDNLGEIKASTMVQAYNFVKTNTNIIHELNKDGSVNTKLKELIKEIEENVKPFLQDYKQYDVIGQFYNEFLRYANGDGGLGIVLTPRHITELFTELAEVNKDSVVIDNCCGTAGFLISAMKRMEDGAKGDKAKIRTIHTKQIIGIDNNPKMFCLACSNMMLRGDGKSNIYQQDCFQVNEEEIKKFKPTIGFLNPPYSKENGHKELAFVENCLGFLQPNGICIAIIPQSCAMNTKKGNLAVKKRLLEKHTLKAVMSMPNTLFEDSEKNSVTCILIFEAHKPHSRNSKTWFGYWKNDGFIKVRPYGRIDYYGYYQNKIKEQWLENYFEKKEIDGLSILKNVDADAEWLVEPYIKTKFEDVKDKDFEDTLREYSTFLFSNKLTDVVSKESYNNTKLSIDFGEWRQIKLTDLFSVAGSKTTDKKNFAEIKDTIGYPYVTTQATNNGIRGFYDIFTDKGNILTIDSAVVGYCSYQPLDFSASDHVEKLTPKFELNVYRALFLTTIINMEQYRYSYGRKYNQPRIRETEIKLPFDENKVDWDFIENYIKGLSYSKHLTINGN